PIDALKINGSGESIPGRTNLANILVVAQVALSLILVVAAGLFNRTLQRLERVPLGFQPDRVLLITVETAHANLGAADRMDLYDRLVASVAVVPGVAGVAASGATPISAGLPRNVAIAGEPPDSEHPALVN